VNFKSGNWLKQVSYIVSVRLQGGEMKFIMVCSAVFICLMLLTSVQVPAQITPVPHPAPKLTNTQNYGTHIQRTMKRIATSTAARKNTVRIMVHGQSWCHQDWVRYLAKWLMTSYPNVDFQFLDPAIGGCASSCLQRPAQYDITSFYPDLLIFQVGITDRPSYESILTTARKNTATELLIWNGYYPAGNDNEASWIRDQVGPKYHAEVVDAYNQFKSYLADNGIGANQLSDGHLTEWGSYVLYELVKAHFVYKAQSPADPDSLVREYRPGIDVNFTNGKLTMKFAGNRIDAVVEKGALPGTGAVVRIDNKSPSTYPACYRGSKTNPEKSCNWFLETCWDNGRDWPWGSGGILSLRWTSVPPTGSWSATLKNVNRTANTFDFDVRYGTTLDGTGNNRTTYSKGVIIDPQDWMVPGSNGWVNAYPFTFENGYKVTWTIEPAHADTFKPVVSSGDPSIEQVVTLAQGLTNADHTLELTALANGIVPIRALRVYRPFLERTASTVPPPVTLRQPPALQPVRGEKVLHHKTLYNLKGSLLEERNFPKNSRLPEGHRRPEGLHLSRDHTGHMKLQLFTPDRR
jgi:hypothetical protein